MVVGREEAGWKVKEIEDFGPNVVSFFLALGAQRWYVAISYVPPNDVTAVHQVDQALVENPKGVETILLGGG